MIARRVNLRVAPRLNSDVLRVLATGEVLHVVECQPVDQDGHAWLHVRGEMDVVPGWVARDYVTPQ